MRYLILFALLCGMAASQTAQVVQLKPEDAEKAKQLHATLDEASKAVAAFNLKIESEYTIEKFDPEDNKILKESFREITRSKRGWEYGFEYSDDYMFIVPKTRTLPSTSICYTSNMYGGISW